MSCFACPFNTFNQGNMAKRVLFACSELDRGEPTTGSTDGAATVANVATSDPTGVATTTSTTEVVATVANVFVACDQKAFPPVAKKQRVFECCDGCGYQSHSIEGRTRWVRPGWDHFRNLLFCGRCWNQWYQTDEGGNWAWGSNPPLATKKLH